MNIKLKRRIGLSIVGSGTFSLWILNNPIYQILSITTTAIIGFSQIAVGSAVFLYFLSRTPSETSGE